jgi:shikimate kinase
MNQENLNYIKKELKLKKNRSEHDKPRFNNQEERDELQEQVTQREKIYHKYNKGEEEVSEREPYLEDTERKSSEDKPINIQIADDVEEDL